MMKVLTPIVLSAPLALAVPMPNPRQLAFMESEMVQFMHFGIPTFWDAPESFLRGSNPTFHDCSSTSVKATWWTMKPASSCQWSHSRSAAPSRCSRTR